MKERVKIHLFVPSYRADGPGDRGDGAEDGVRLFRDQLAGHGHDVVLASGPAAPAHPDCAMFVAPFPAQGRPLSVPNCAAVDGDLPDPPACAPLIERVDKSAPVPELRLHAPSEGAGPSGEVHAILLVPGPEGVDDGIWRELSPDGFWVRFGCRRLHHGRHPYLVIDGADLAGMPVQDKLSAPPRRQVLALVAGGAVASAAGAVGAVTAPNAAAAARKPATARPTSPPRPPPIPPSIATTAATSTVPFSSGDPNLHLLRRATYGVTPESMAELRSMGAPAWLERQLRPTTIDDSACAALIARFSLISLDVPGVRAKVAAGAFPFGAWDVILQVASAAIARAIWSKRQLFEVMVDFWSNHLNVTNPSSEVWDNRQVYDRMIRATALGRYADMLKASAISPAMLNYLDNKSSTKLSPNENYGRELLELHTVGTIHTEADVKNAARLLTGLTLDGKGQYVYNPAIHATGPVTVLGFKHANGTAEGGQAAAFALIDYLAMHPATAQRIAHRLCVRFVADDPPAALVTRLANVYLTERTAITPVLRALFGSAEFAASVGMKVRTPYEDMMATVRVLGIAPEPVNAPDQNATGTHAMDALRWLLEDAGNAPMGWPTPDGYPDVATAWASTSGYLVRWNAHITIATGWWPTQLTRQASLVRYLLPTVPRTHGALVTALCQRLLGTTMRPEHATALLTFLGRSATSPLAAGDEALGAKFEYLVALILNSPYFSIR